MNELKGLLERAKTPFVLVGGGGWNGDACRQLQSWIEKAGLPVGAVIELGVASTAITPPAGGE